MKTIASGLRAKLAAAAVVAMLTGTIALPVAQARPSPEQQLDKMLAGRIAGKPVDCISRLDSSDVQVIDKTAIVYGSGRTIYVNRPVNAGSLDSDDILVTTIRGGGGQLCRLDDIKTRDRSSHFPTGFVNLGQFVPYQRVATRD